MSAKVRWKVDVRDVDKELDRLQDGFGTPDILRLEATLMVLFQRTQRAVHIDTGSLYLSGQVSSRRTGDRWRGTISYGGRSPGGINNPVKYAGYEQHRGGLHDFMRPLYDNAVDDDYVDALIDFLRGRGR